MKDEWTEDMNVEDPLDLSDIRDTNPYEKQNSRRELYKNLDPKMRMDKIASKFMIRNNPDLWKMHYKTGFKLLDEALGGGFTPGVHYIGAISSLGKSTFALQMADSMAATGQPVIYVSLEMPRLDLTAKLVSMYTCRFNQHNLYLAKTSNMLMNRKIMDHFSDEEWETIEKAASTVEEHGKLISVLESQINPVTIEHISEYIKYYSEIYNSKPVVFVDYLQILSSPKELRSSSDKQVIDYTVAKFRALSATYNIPIIVISSFNRDNYNTKVSLQAFKESGNIEYSADSLIGLQLEGVGGANFDIDKAKSGNPRKIELVLLKQRYGPTVFSIKYNFYTRYNWFEEVGWKSVPFGYGDDILKKQPHKRISLNDVNKERKEEEII